MKFRKMKRTLVILSLLSVMTGCSVTVQVVLYQRGGNISAPNSGGSSDADIATSGGGTPSFTLPLEEDVSPQPMGLKR